MKTIQQPILILAATLLFSNDITAQKQWFTIGTPGFSAGAVQYTSLGVDQNGIRYVAYTDAANGDKATVMRYDGTNWVAVGNAGFSPAAAHTTSLDLDSKGVPYVAFQDQGNNNKTTVMKYDGTQWVGVGVPGLSAGSVYQTCIAFDNNDTLYIAYRDSANGAKATVKKYNGTSWVNVGIEGFSMGAASELKLAIDNIGNPYVMYTDLSLNNRGYVMKFDGNNWVIIGNPSIGNSSFSNSDIRLASLAFGKNDTPYVAYYYDFPASYVKKWDGTQWDLAYYFAPRKISCLAMDSSGIPYVAYTDTAGGKMSVSKYNGGIWPTPWVSVGQSDFSSGSIDYASMVFDKDNVPIVTYQDGGNGNKATAMIYQCHPEVKVNICALVIDSVQNRYVTIAWDTSTVSGLVDSFRIYREDNGNYINIGNVPATINDFNDANALSLSQSYRYKVTYLDKCGRNLPLDSSTAHRTIMLSFDYLIDEKVSVTWNSYEGISNLTYTVMRSNEFSSFIPIASFGVTGSDTTYIDMNPPTGSNRYRIDAALPSPCKVSNFTFDKITSNTVTAWHTGIKEVGNSDKIMLNPNPAQNELKVTATETLTKIDIFSLTGQRLMTNRPTSGKESLIDVSSLQPGTYYMKVNDIHNATFIKQ